jgi:hypothetical protein
MAKLKLYSGTVKSTAGGRHFMAWATGVFVQATLAPKS